METSVTGLRPRQPDRYHGQRDFLLLGNWIFSVDQYFILTDMPIYKQGPFVSTLLRDEALLWYRANYENWDPSTPLTWQILRTAMREYFAPPNEDRRLQDEWANLKQYGTVFEYVSVLMALAMQIPSLSQIQILDKFICSLKPKTRIEVELRDPKTPEEAYRLADRFDRIVYGQRWQSIQTIRAEGSARIGQIKLKGLLDLVRCFKVEARFGSMLDVLNRVPAWFESSILKVLLGSIKLGPSCSIRLDIV